MAPLQFTLFAAEFLGEALIFGVAGTLLLLDTARNSRKEEARRAAIDAKFSELYGRIKQLESQLPTHDSQQPKS